MKRRKMKQNENETNKALLSMRICFGALCGIPGSGKSTFCQSILEFSKNNKLVFGIIWIDFDRFITTNFNCLEELKQKNYKKSRQLLLESIENLAEMLKVSPPEQIYRHHLISDKNSHLKEEILILLDDNMFYKSMRYKILQIARKLQTGYFEIYFQSDLRTAVFRNSNRTQKVPTEIIEKMYYQLEKPTNFTNILVIDVENNHSTYLDSLSVMFVKAQETKQIQTTDEVENHQCELHQIDLILRKEISKIIKETRATSENLKLLAENLNVKRKQLLIDIRTKIIEMPSDLTHIIHYLN